MQSADTVGQRELRVVGLSRSGNHAIINWLLAQMEGRTCFLNCVQPKQNPFATARETVAGEAAICNYQPFDLQREAEGDFSQKDWLLYSYEDCFITMVCNKAWELQHDQLVGKSHSRTDAVILRDPFNLFASRLRSSYSGVTPLTATRIWKQHARQVLNQRNLFSQPHVAILYNHWVSDADYRCELANQLGLRFTDKGFTRVAATGGGSSFDGLHYDGQAQRMSVLDRWRHYIDDPTYLRMFDEELIELSQAIFGDLPAAKAIRKRMPPGRRRPGNLQTSGITASRPTATFTGSAAADDLSSDVA